MAEVTIPEDDSSLTTQLIDPKSNFITKQYKQFEASDIRGLLQTLRWANFLLMLVIMFFAFFGTTNAILTLSLNLALLNTFCFLFSGILALYELHMKKLSIRIRRNFGFLFTYIGRSVYIFFISTILFSPQTFLLNILGIVTMCFSFVNIFVILVHPAFRKGELHLLDDPSLGYSSGDSEIKNIMVNNPNMAQKVLEGAVKLSVSKIIICLLERMNKEAFVIPKFVATNISFDREPRNAIEYLISVRKEAEAMPDFVTINNNEEENEEEYNEEEEYMEEEEESIEEEQDEWTQFVVERFLQLRNSIANKKEELLKDGLVFPHINDESGWFHYCFPKSKEGEQDYSDPTHYHCRLPQISELVNIDFVTTNALLKYHYEWLYFDELHITKDICVWLYALLAIIELPLSGDVASDIRGIYTYFKKYKENYKKDPLISDEESNTLIACIDTILIITGEIFHQNY